MGIATADFSLDGRPDLFVTNSRDQLHAAYRSRRRAKPWACSSTRARSSSAALGHRVDGLGEPPGSISTSTATSTSPSRTGRSPSGTSPKDAQRVQVLENRRTAQGRRFAPSDHATRADQSPRRQRTRPRGGRLRQRRRPRSRGQLDRGTAAPPREPRGRRDTGSRCGSRRSRPERSSPPCSPTVAGSSARCTPVAATCRPRIRASTSASGRDQRAGASRALPGRKRRTSTGLKADRRVTVVRAQSTVGG